ncbi:MAG: lytic murein transglycosylase [Solirubrobacterales bacterium]|nr:lytic murein transglycosylase [Solirubrobacterales bacterium]
MSLAHAAPVVSGPPAPAGNPALAGQTDAGCDPATGDCGTAAEPAPPATAPPAPSGNDSGSDSTGGVAPTPRPSPNGGNTGSGKGAQEITPPSSEPKFVEEDPDLSGGVSPDADRAGGDPLEVAPLSVPNFLINRFEIPPFLLPIYQACGSEYGVPWEVLAAINRIETAFGTNVSTSSAGAMGWMQFIPSSWEMYGVDANGDGEKDPYNPVDAICAAGNYLQAAGYADDPSGAIFSYNHADWYVADILEHARGYAQIPPEMISALTGLTEGARFPIAAESEYEGQISTEQAGRNGLASQDVSSSDDRTSVEIRSEPGAPVIAVNDGVISSIDQTTGTVVLKDAYGNRYSYAGLGTVAKVHPVPKERKGAGPGVTESDPDPPSDRAPSGDADMGEVKAHDEAGHQRDRNDRTGADGGSSEPISEVLVDPAASASAEGSPPEGSDSGNPTLAAADERRAEQTDISAASETDTTVANSEDMRGRVYASPLRPHNQKLSTIDGQSVNNTPGVSLEGKPGDYLIYDGSKAGIYRFDPDKTDLRPLRKGSRVIAGTVLGRLAETPGAAIRFSIQPGGDDTPQIDPKPFLDGWKLLAETNIYNARGKNRFADRLGVSGVLLLSKPALQKRVLNDPGLDIYECGRQDIASGFTDRRILALLAFLRERGYTMTITSLTCGHSTYSSSGYVSQHTTGSAVDIAIVNGQVITPATQGPGTITDEVIRQILTLQGTMEPDQVISLMDFPGSTSFAMSDHGDHIHVGFSPVEGTVAGGSISASLGAAQWQRLTDRLGQIRNPRVPTTPSKNSLPADSSDKDE